MVKRSKQNCLHFKDEAEKSQILWDADSALILDADQSWDENLVGSIGIWQNGIFFCGRIHCKHFSSCCLYSFGIHKQIVPNPGYSVGVILGLQDPKSENSDIILLLPSKEVPRNDFGGDTVAVTWDMLTSDFRPLGASCFAEIFETEKQVCHPFFVWFNRSLNV